MEALEEAQRAQKEVQERLDEMESDHQAGQTELRGRIAVLWSRRS